MIRNLLLFNFYSISLSLPQLTMVETVTTTLFDYMPSLRHRKPLVVACVCFVIFLLGLSMCLEGGILMFELFFWYSAGISVIILAIAQIVGVVWVYGRLGGGEGGGGGDAGLLVQLVFLF